MANPAVSSAKRVARDDGTSAGIGHAGTGTRAVARTAGPPLPRVREFVHTQIDRALENGEIEVLIGALLAATRRRESSESESIKAYVFQQILELLEDPTYRRTLWPWTRLCAARPETQAREMACALLDSFWRDHRKEVERLTLNLARDEDEGVRQYAAATMSRIVRANFRLRFRH